MSCCRIAVELLSFCCHFLLNGKQDAQWELTGDISRKKESEDRSQEWGQEQSTTTAAYNSKDLTAWNPGGATCSGESCCLPR